jgi:hypothetical protein
METKLKRDELDRLAEFYSLTPARADQMLKVADAQPSRAQQLRFFARCLQYAGVLSLAAGVVFFIAANWSRIAVFGRFALLQVLFVALIAFSLRRPPPRFVGRTALFLAFIVAGALLALFGQTYQTGADVYELFLTWALLGLPLVIAGQWGLSSAAWVLVLNTALLLFCGWQPRGGLMWALFDGQRFDTTHAILAAAALNVVLWIAAEHWRIAAVPEWVRRLTLFFAFVFITWAGLLGVSGSDIFFGHSRGDALALIGAAAAAVVVGANSLRLRRDVYPLALVLGSTILVVFCWIPNAFDIDELPLFFLMALWLCGASAVGGRGLMLLMREWRTPEPA